MGVELRPVKQKVAFPFIERHHRHHDVPAGALWQHGAHDDDGCLIGVAIVGRPVARMLDEGLTVEVTRLCTLGNDNACSLLYSACRRASDAKGYRRGLTYILESEFAASKGASLRAAGYRYLGRTKDKDGWDRNARRRDNAKWQGPKYRFGWGEWPQWDKSDIDADFAALQVESEAA